jgi:HSP20 family protein
MVLVRRAPWRNLSFLQDQINRIFWEAFPEPRGEENDVNLSTWYPSVNIHETDQSIVIQAELAGLKREDIAIGVKENILTLDGERTEDKEIKEENYYLQERRSGKFHRSFTLPAAIRPEKVVATYRAGVLEIKIPKPEEQKPKQVDIR